MKKGYKSAIVILIIVLICIIIYMSLINSGAIRNYHIKDFVINVTMDTSGDIHVKEDTVYRFNGKYNGITITIPTDVSEELYNKLTQDSMNDSKILPDSLYISNGIENVNIYVVENGTNRYFEQVGRASIGDKGVYTVTEENGFTTYTIYEPSTSENKQIVIEYTLKDVMVQHQDCSELFWNFIGGEVACEINNLEINLYGQNILRAYTHGNASGKIENTANMVEVKYRNVQPGEFVSTRVALNNYSKNMKKQTGINALPIIEKLEQSYQSKKDTVITLSSIAISMTVIILIYWIVLLIKYEKEIEPVSLVADDVNILDKYNPMISACIAQNRGMHPRDILAVLIDLVNIKALKMVHIRGDIIGSKNDMYRLSKNQDFFSDKEKTKTLDEIQTSVVDIFFGEYEEIELTKRLTEIKNATSVIEQLKLLDDKVATKLESLGANYKSVPKSIRTINNCIFVVVCIYIVIMLAYNISLRYVTLSTEGFNVEIMIPIILAIAFSLIFGLLPLVVYGIKGLVHLVNYIRKKVSKLTFKMTTKKLTKRLIIITLAFIIVGIFEIYVIKDTTVIIATLLFFVSLLVILTDNLMSQHRTNIKKEYVILKLLQDKIENGSLLEEKNIQDNILWGRYFTFAIALGVGNVARYVKYIPDFSNMESIVDSFYNTTDGGFMLYNLDKELNVKRKLDRFSKSMDNFATIYFNSSGGGSGSGYSGSRGGFSSGGGSFSGGGGRGGGRGAF